jgi:predicted DNA-binding ribbon-helix-helix protein
MRLMQHVPNPSAQKRGRPTVFSWELADRICRRIAEGQTLRAICSKHGYPSKSSVTRWLAQNDQFWDQYARAREQQAHALIDEAVDLGRSADGNTASELRLKIDTLKWAAAKLSPKVYGKRATIGPIEDWAGESEDDLDVSDTLPRTRLR